MSYCGIDWNIIGYMKMKNTSISQSLFRLIRKNDLALIMIAGLLVRVISYFLSPNINFIDEIYQYIEPAYSYYYDKTIVTWEYKFGLRNWLWPNLLALAIWPAQTFFGTLFAFKFSIVLFCSLLSLISIYAAYMIGSLENRNIGILAAFFTAFWSDFVYFSSHPTIEVVANNFLMLGLALALCANKASVPESSTHFRNRFLLCGVMLGFAFAFRFHLAPALAFIGFFILFKNKSNALKYVLIGSIFPVIIYGYLDYIKIGYPFKSIYNSININIFYGIAQKFSITPFYTYLVDDTFLAIALILSMWLIFVDFKNQNNKFSMLFYTSIVILIFHSLIGHKELRFIYSAYMLMLLFVLIKIALIKNTRKISTYSMAIIVSFSVIAGFRYRNLWDANQQYILAAEFLNKKQNICGLGLYGIEWLLFPGTAFFQKDVYIYKEDTAKIPHSQRLHASYNYLLASDTVDVKAGFTREICYSIASNDKKACIYSREGTCFVSRNDALSNSIGHSRITDNVNTAP